MGMPLHYRRKKQHVSLVIGEAQLYHVTKLNSTPVSSGIKSLLSHFPRLRLPSVLDTIRT